MGIKVGYKERIDQYASGRPSYPEALMNFIFANFTKDATVADIGAGTGIFTKLMAERFSKVYAIEPEEGMRNVLNKVAQETTNIITSDGSAEHTGLDDNSVDLICAAQAFHWFNATAFHKEALRIMRPNGKLFIIHNIPPDITMNITLNNIEKPETIKLTLAKRKEDRINFFGNDLKLEIFDNSTLYDKDRYIKYIMSLSTGPDMKDGYLLMQLVDKIGDNFDKISKNGLVVLPFVTELYTTKGFYK